MKSISSKTKNRPNRNDSQRERNRYQYLQEREITNIIKVISQDYRLGFYPIESFKRWFPKIYQREIFLKNLVSTLQILTETTDKHFYLSTNPIGFSIKQKKAQIVNIDTNVVKKNNGTTITLCVYSNLSNVLCIKSKNHNPKNITIETKNIKNKNVSFNAFYCVVCKKYFTTIDVIKNKFPSLDFPLVKYDFTYLNSDSYRKGESELTLYGYNVRADGLSGNERRTLLSQLLIMKILSKERIIAILRNNINYNGRKKNLQAAVQRWENDIEFVQKFDLNKQQKVYSNKVDMIYKGKSLQ